MDFQRLRDEWALKVPVPTKAEIEHQQAIDRNANPHNDNYPNKRPIRSVAQIICDVCYTQADNILRRQYPNEYSVWLEREGYRTNQWGITTKERS